MVARRRAPLGAGPPLLVGTPPGGHAGGLLSPRQIQHHISSLSRGKNAPAVLLAFLVFLVKRGSLTRPQTTPLISFALRYSSRHIYSTRCRLESKALSETKHRNLFFLIFCFHDKRFLCGVVRRAEEATRRAV